MPQEARHDATAGSGASPRHTARNLPARDVIRLGAGRPRRAGRPSRSGSRRATCGRPEGRTPWWCRRHSPDQVRRGRKAGPANMERSLEQWIACPFLPRVRPRLAQAPTAQPRRLAALRFSTPVEGGKSLRPRAAGSYDVGRQLFTSLQTSLTRNWRDDPAWLAIGRGAARLFREKKNDPAGPSTRCATARWPPSRSVPLP